MSSAGSNRNVRTREFRELFAKLPRRVQSLARATFLLFLRNPRHDSLRLHQLSDSGKGRHRPGTWSVSITMKYRALYVVEDERNVWYWIGSHNDCENFTGKK
jgi:hypothetical protein